MALLDVSEVLTDPDFCDRLQVARNAQTVGADGRGIITPTNYTFYGVVTNGSGDVLERSADGERVHGTIVIHSKFRLSAGRKAGQTADVVTWRKRTYTVRDVDDYSNFGAGFSAAVCDLIPLSG